MNTRISFSLAAAVLAFVAASSVDKPADPAPSEHIVELHTVTVYPSAQDAAYFQAHRIVDLPRITVYPDPSDFARSPADKNASMLHLPIALPHAPVADTHLPTASSATSSYALAAR